MPHNKSEKIHNQQDDASQKSHARTPKENEIAERPASLNGISKENP
ncbi:hypothetical protein [Paenibacillus soyae]|uniref:Small acid-soluble spore protein P n=1 Tax=Paenibacillus soyae TaxID=2969249 RepID=A0A9X2MLK5_9BACL|nr:hypothetical protein [Paenibacillus soyae]MCR2802854.1 hypothetical protein [Paenibacillus soyae]